MGFVALLSFPIGIGAAVVILLIAFGLAMAEFTGIGSAPENQAQVFEDFRALVRDEAAGLFLVPEAVADAGLCPASPAANCREKSTLAVS